MLKVTQAQVDKHMLLNERNNRNAPPVKLDAEIVPAEQAEAIGAWYGSLYICILPDGSSHS